MCNNNNNLFNVSFYIYDFVDKFKLCLIVFTIQICSKLLHYQFQKHPVG